MRHLKTILAILGAATVLVLAGNTITLAATGQGLILGKTNFANAVTTVERTTAGPALKITNDSASSAPIVTNGTGKVLNLNVDKVDGLEGGTRAYSWSYVGAVTGNETFELDGLPAGTYLISYSVYFGSLSSDNGLISKCYLASSAGGGTFGAETAAPETSTTFPALSGTTLLAQAVGGITVLTCTVPGNAATTWAAPSNQPLRITAIPISGVTNRGAPTLNGKVQARAK